MNLTAYVRGHLQCQGSELLRKALEGKEHSTVDVDELIRGEDEEVPPWLTGTPMLLVEDLDTRVRTAMPPAQAFEYLEFEPPPLETGEPAETTATSDAIERLIEQRKKEAPAIAPNEASRIRDR